MFSINKPMINHRNVILQPSITIVINPKILLNYVKCYPLIIWLKNDIVVWSKNNGEELSNDLHHGAHLKIKEEIGRRHCTSTEEVPSDPIIIIHILHNHVCN